MWAKIMMFRFSCLPLISKICLVLIQMLFQYASSRGSSPLQSQFLNVDWDRDGASGSNSREKNERSEGRGHLHPSSHWEKMSLQGWLKVTNTWISRIKPLVYINHWSLKIPEQYEMNYVCRNTCSFSINDVSNKLILEFLWTLKMHFNFVIGWGFKSAVSTMGVKAALRNTEMLCIGHSFSWITEKC